MVSSSDFKKIIVQLQWGTTQDKYNYDLRACQTSNLKKNTFLRDEIVQL